MKDIQPYQPPYQFPTSLPAQPSGLTPYQKQQIETDFASHPAFQRRRIVTIVTVSLCVGLFVTHVLTHGINIVALVASIVGGVAAFGCRNYSIPKR